jgi:hypothetical protein
MKRSQEAVPAALPVATKDQDYLPNQRLMENQTGQLFKTNKSFHQLPVILNKGGTPDCALPQEVRQFMGTVQL